MTEIALPRIKVKKRKRRPPTLEEKMAIIISIWSIGCALSDLILAFIQISIGWCLLDLAFGLFQLYWFRRNWPIAYNYIKNGYIDE